MKPEFGAVFGDVTRDDVRVIESMSAHQGLGSVERVAFFHVNQTPKFRVYVRQHGTWSEGLHIKTPNAIAQLGVPVPFEIDANVPLPDSVPLDFLASGKPVAGVGRAVLRSVWDGLVGNVAWFDSDASVQSNATQISDIFRQVRQATPQELQAFGLASDLLKKVVGIQDALFVELQEAVRTKNGYANSLVDTINDELAKALNFPHWWSQDSQFELYVSLYEYDLVFMIRDRTGRTYGFDERSDGLKYFLSYFVQYLAHESRQDGRPEILLMDEPDRFLSSSGQQDLLRIFEDFAEPKDAGRLPVQVVYVTHSPFLIDKNEADRIRVLEKGEHDEGTRVVSSAAANHYEPLRSAFGSFVAETTFIGNCNLMVEGPSDQVLVAGASRWLKILGVGDRDRIDLNRMTVVPAGGTRHIPYLVYLARGRDVDKPPVVVLLDNDGDGDRAKEDLAAGGAYGAKLIDPELVLQLGHDSLSELRTDNPMGVAGIEDLVPLGVAVEAADIYCREFVPSVNVQSLRLNVDEVFPASSTTDGAVSYTTRNRGTLKFLEMAIGQQANNDSFHLDKVAFARAVIDVLFGRSDGGSVDQQDIDTVRTNFSILLSSIARKQRAAERAESVEKISSRINRVKRDFSRTHRDQARKEDVLALVEEISTQLDNSPEAEEVRSVMRGWYQKFSLDDDPRGLVDDYAGLLQSVDGLAYQAIRAAASA
ncbi:AAA family ATPase [Mycolicibacterium mucogenicum]|nr:AAA family ATPase [Mycolicibacterium mucogenicum]